MYPYMQNQQNQPGQQDQQQVNPLPQQMAQAMLELQRQRQMMAQMQGQPQMPQQQLGGLLSPITDNESLLMRAQGGLFGFGNFQR